MFSFLTFHCTGLWIFRCFILLSVVNHSGAQGDPTRIPTSDERVGLIPTAKFIRWPSCANFLNNTVCDGQLVAALNSSVETWCTATLFGGCMSTGTFFKMPKFCSLVGSSSWCRGACLLPDEPRQLFGWVNATCGDEAHRATMESWGDMTMAKETEWVISEWIPALFPWNWTVQALEQPATLSTLGIQITDPRTSLKPYVYIPPSGPGICNTSTSEKLGVFAAVNVVSAILLPIIGRRTLIHKLTFGCLGTLGSRWWPLMGVLSALLHVFANLANAYLTRATPGYEDVPIGALTLLWCTRPRLSWLAVFLAAIQADEGMYFGCAAAAITSEAILQVLGAVYFGISANYARKKRFYVIGQLNAYPRGVDAHVMYAGALLWLIMAFVTLFACNVCIVGLGEVIAKARKVVEELQEVAAKSGNVISGPIQGWLNGPSGRWVPKFLRRIFDRQKKTPKKKPRKLTEEEIREIQSIINAGIIFISFLAQWLFWAGFVKAAKERYCPPKLEILGAIWTLLSAVGTFLGSAH